MRSYELGSVLCFYSIHAKMCVFALVLVFGMFAG